MTDAILACYDRGWLRRTSVIVNGPGWEHAVAALGRRPLLPVVLHVNLFEGSPLSAASEVDLLVNDRGRFNLGFWTLWVHASAGSNATRLRRQIRLEVRRQIERFLEAFGDRGLLSVDSHVHYHVLPPVFDELLRLSAEYPIGAIRLPREPLYWPLTRVAPRPPLVNVAKNILLKTLCRRVRSALQSRGLQTTEAFVGVLGTGAMTLAHVRAALTHLNRAGTTGRVEILFHPGRARPDEAVLWHDRPELQALYLSADRDREAELLCSAELGELLRACCGTDGAPPAPGGEVSS
jgi:predicted glycoside hydrolase/deacetylase ChbG (UPF0249 family)